MTRRHVLVAGSMAAVAVLAVVFWPRGHRRGAAGSGDPSAVAAGDRSGGGEWWRRLPPQLPSNPAGVPNTLPPGVTPGTRPTGDVRKELEDYKRAAQYPPHSRPLDRDDKLLEPTIVQTVRRPAFDTQSADRGPTDYTFLFTGDRANVTGREVLTTTLAVFRGPDAQHAAPSRVVSAQVSPSGGGATIGGGLAYVDDGTAGDVTAADNVHTNELSPAELGVTQAGYYAIDIAFTHPGGSSTGTLAFFYTPEDRVAGRFTGQFEDRIVDGSLVVSAEVEVIRPGEFVVDANLFDAGALPIARATFRGELGEGRATVDLQFFGKILRDAGRDGPYVVRHVRGYRALPGQTPSRESMATFEGEHRTKPYDVTDFSDAEWDSAEKARRIHMLEQILAGRRKDM